MSYVSVSRNIAGERQAAANRFGGWLRARMQDWSVRRAQRRSRAELYAVSDRTLRDIGVSRSELGSLAVHGNRDTSRRRRRVL